MVQNGWERLRELFSGGYGHIFTLNLHPFDLALITCGFLPFDRRSFPPLVVKLKNLLALSSL